MSNIYALQTARKGSKSVINKNIMDINGKPLFAHPIDKALKSELIKEVYISTDIKLIIDNKKNRKYRTIIRPDNLCGDNSSHHDVMIHGLEYIEKEKQEKVDYLVVLLGNSLGSPGSEIDEALKFLIENALNGLNILNSDTVCKPSYSLFSIKNGNLETCMSQKEIKDLALINNVNDKKSAGNVYFANGSFFICKRDVLLNKIGKLPYPWLGNKIKPWVQNVNMEIDAYWQSFVLREINKEENK